jgi:hypothetical protein
MAEWMKVLTTIPSALVYSTLGKCHRKHLYYGKASKWFLKRISEINASGLATIQGRAILPVLETDRTCRSGYVQVSESEK